MKATLKFKLPKEGKAFLAAVKGEDTAIVLWEIVYNLSKRIQGHYDAMDDKEYSKLRPMDGVIYTLDEIREMLNDYGIDINQLTE